MNNFGLIGWSIKHSLSPKIYNSTFRKKNLNWKYVLIPTMLKNLSDLIEMIRGKNFLSVNITSPYKESIIPYLDCITNKADKIGSVNIVFSTGNGEIIGDNTDSDGFLNDIKNKKIFTFGKSVTILGYGGSSKAICHALKKMQVSSIEIWSRGSGKVPISADLTINCTPGLDSCILEKMLFDSSQILYDLNYAPNETPIMQMAKNYGAIAFNGFGMLREQAKLNFKIWQKLNSYKI